MPFLHKRYLFPAFFLMALLTGFAEETGRPQPPAPSEPVARALKEFRAAREKISIGGVMKTAEVQPIHDAFWAALDAEKVSLTDARAIVQAPVFSFHREKAMALRQRLQVIAADASEREAVIALALSFPLQRPAGEKAEDTDKLFRRFLTSPELPALLQGDYAGIVLNAIARLPHKLAQENAALVLGFADRLDPLTSTHAAPAVENYWDAAVKLTETPDQREALRRRLLEFVSGTLPVLERFPELEERRAWIEKTAIMLDSALVRGKFVGFPAPALNFTWASRPDLKTLSDLRGKVVLLDFWATWCGPCIASFPQTRAFVELYRNSPVEVIGVTSLQGTVILPTRGPVACKGEPEKEFKLLQEFHQAHQLPWSIAVSREPVFNPEYGIKGIPAVVILAPDGTVRHAGLHPGKSLEEQRKLIDPILKEFGLKIPPL